MTTSIKILGSCIGAWDSVGKKFNKILDLTMVSIPFTKKTQLDIDLSTGAAEAIEMNAVANAKALVFYSSLPITIFLNGETIGHICDPIYVATNKSAAAGAYTSVIVQRVNNADTTVTIGMYE